MVIRRFGVLSVAKIWGTLYALFGLIAGVILALISLAGGFASMATQENGGPGAFMGIFFGVGAVIFAPLFYGALGFIVGLIGSALYNWLAGMVGGIEVELQGAPVLGGVPATAQPSAGFPG